MSLAGLIAKVSRNAAMLESKVNKLPCDERAREMSEIEKKTAVIETHVVWIRKTLDKQFNGKK